MDLCQTYYDCNKDLKDGYREVCLWQDKSHGIFLIFLIFVEYFDCRNLWDFQNVTHNFCFLGY